MTSARRPLAALATVAVVVVVSLGAFGATRALAVEGPGYGGDGGGLRVSLLRDGTEVAGPPNGGGATSGYAVRVSGGGWLAATTLRVEVPGADPTVAVTDATGSFRTVVPMPSTDRPSGTVRVEGPGPDLLPRALSATVPTPSSTDPRLLALAAAALVMVGTVAVPHLHRPRRSGGSPPALGPET